jgi:hypothetical protein
MIDSAAVEHSHSGRVKLEVDGNYWDHVVGGRRCLRPRERVVSRFEL